MNKRIKRRTGLRRNGELLVVQDMSMYSKMLAEGKLVQEEFDLTFGNDLRNGKNFNTEDGEKFLRLYGGKIPFFMGGSNAGVVEGHSKYKSKRYLQLEKLGMVEKTTLPSQQFLYDYGHYFEDAVGMFCAGMMRKDGIDVVYVPCDFGYITTLYPTFLAHPDGFLLDRKTGRIVALAEVKTSLKTGAAWNEEFRAGIVPEDYIDQVQAYMQVLGLDHCYVLAHSKHGDGYDDFVYIHVERDQKRAIKILQNCEDFVYDTASGIEYDDELLAGEIPHVYPVTDPDLGFVPLKRNVQGTIERLDDLADQKAVILDEVREGNALLRKIEAEEKKLKSSLLGKIGSAPGGLYETDTDVYRIAVSRDFSFDKEVKKVVAEKYPDVWSEITSLKPTLKATVTKTSKQPHEYEAAI